MYNIQNKAQEKAVIVGVQLPGVTDEFFYASLRELASLAETAGARPVGELTQKLPHPAAATFLGRGKTIELKKFIQETGADIALFDHDLSPVQMRNLQDELAVKVIDRSQIILDIFALRAKTREAKLQVELAQLQYILPRLGGLGRVLSREGGGIGTRGPGETKLESDRRRIRHRISVLRDSLKEIKKHRALLRNNRKENRIVTAALVGYTNAGKSSLFNALMDYCHRGPEKVYVEDKLFATLDTTTRRLNLPCGKTILITDTVGFIQNLPTHLVAAFHSTLEEISEADVIVHVVDVSDEQYQEKIAVVIENLKALKAEEQPQITVFNKIDRITPPGFNPKENPFEPRAAVSAQTGEGVAQLVDLLGKISPSNLF